ncbi:MAG: SPFH domain-containing protein [Pseudomonadota bacterium]
MAKWLLGVCAVAVVALIAAMEAIFTVEPWEAAVVTQGGEVAEVRGPGVFAKIPWVQEVHRVNVVEVRRRPFALSAKAAGGKTCEISGALEFNLIAPGAAYLWARDRAAEGLEPDYGAAAVDDFTRAMKNALLVTPGELADAGGVAAWVRDYILENLTAPGPDGGGKYRAVDLSVDCGGEAAQRAPARADWGDWRRFEQAGDADAPSPEARLAEPFDVEATARDGARVRIERLALRYRVSDPKRLSAAFGDGDQARDRVNARVAGVAGGLLKRLIGQLSAEGVAAVDLSALAVSPAFEPLRDLGVEPLGFDLAEARYRIGAVEN